MPNRPMRYALLRLLLGGICNNDLELCEGYYGFVGTPGHEFVAEVVEADTPENQANDGGLYTDVGKRRRMIISKTPKTCHYGRIHGFPAIYPPCGARY
jgi:D-arabinose 1-dehydrogenase-like Zn-dependent alcohol dehydrogenase